MNSDTKIQDSEIKVQRKPSKHLFRLKVAGVLFTILGIGLFSYFIYSVGFYEILEGISRIGWEGFAAILVIYFLRILTRASAWRLSVYQPYRLGLRDTIPAVIIGEAMSSMIPLGILISGTAKAVAVKKRVPLVVGLSSVATENLFYSLITSLFIIFGAFTLLRTFSLPEMWVVTIDVFIGVIVCAMIFAIIMVVRQWHFASETCEWLYERGIAKNILEHGRLQVRLFENLIYGFYRQYPRRFLPILLFETTFHALGILEVWFILTRISEAFPSFFNAFLLESVSRIITTTFKLIPFVIGVDEAGARFVTETLALGAGLGVTLAIIRKGRVLFWTGIGVTLIIKRGLSLKEISKIRREEEKKAAIEDGGKKRV